jgi:hypothetical protein
MTTVAQESPVLLVPLTAVDTAGFLGDLLSAESVNDPDLDDGASDTERIVAAAGAVESLEWKLDRARAAFVSAVERAASNGCSVERIAESAGMTKEDVATLLWAARSEHNEL